MIQIFYLLRRRIYFHLLALNLFGISFSLKCRIAEYHLNHYESAHAAFSQGHQLDGECG